MDPVAARAPVGHQTSRGRENIDAHSPKHFRHRRAAHIHAATGLRHALDLGHDLLTFRSVAQVNANVPVHSLTDYLVVVYEALFFQYSRDLDFDFRKRHINLLMLGPIRVSHASQHICNWICHTSPDA